LDRYFGELKNKKDPGCKISGFVYKLKTRENVIKWLILRIL